MIDCFNFSCAEKDEYLSLDQIVEYSFTCKAEYFSRDAQMVGSQVLPCTIVPRDQVVTKNTLTLSQLVTNINKISFHWFQGI